MDEPKLVDYPRAGAALPPRRQPYAKDASQAIYVLGASGIGVLMSGMHALGFHTTPGHQRGAIVLTVLNLARLGGGLGMVGSRRWGLATVLVVSLLYVAFGVLAGSSALTSTLLWILFSLWLVVYCGVRLIGREGPKPI